MDKMEEEETADDHRMSHFSQVISMVFVTIVMVFLYILILFF